MRNRWIIDIILRDAEERLVSQKRIYARAVEKEQKDGIPIHRIEQQLPKMIEMQQKKVDLIKEFLSSNPPD